MCAHWHMQETHQNESNYGLQLSVSVALCFVINANCLKESITPLCTVITLSSRWKEAFSFFFSGPNPPYAHLTPDTPQCSHTLSSQVLAADDLSTNTCWGTT